MYQDTEAFCHNLLISTAPEKSGTVSIHVFGKKAQENLKNKYMHENKIRIKQEIYDKKFVDQKSLCY